MEPRRGSFGGKQPSEPAWLVIKGKISVMFMIYIAREEDEEREKSVSKRDK